MLDLLDGMALVGRATVGRSWGCITGRRTRGTGEGGRNMMCYRRTVQGILSLVSYRGQETWSGHGCEGEKGKREEQMY